jgi:hypothetical protein
MLDRSWENGGLLIVNERESAQIWGSMRKCTTEMEKFHDMCAYQFEMGYDLAISPGCNVSYNRLFLRACFPTARSPTARYFGLCLGGVTLNFKLSGQFLRAVPKMRAVGRKNDTDRTQKSIFACGRCGGYSTLE